MILRTFWIWHKNEDSPDCESAWSQWSVDENPEGWEAEKAAVLARYGDGIHSHREIELAVPDDAIFKTWWPDPIDAKVAT